MSQFQNPEEPRTPTPFYPQTPVFEAEPGPEPAPVPLTRLPNRWEIGMTLGLAAIAAGGAFFGSNWDSGYMQAIHVAGTTFFVTLSGLLTALGIDPRRRV